MSAFFLNSHMNLFFINLCYISIPVNLNLSLVFSYFLIHASILLISYCFLKRVKNMLIQGSWVFRLRTQSHFVFPVCHDGEVQGAVGLSALCGVPLVLCLTGAMQLTADGAAQSLGSAWPECCFCWWVLIAAKHGTCFQCTLNTSFSWKTKVCLNSCFHFLCVAVMY